MLDNFGVSFAPTSDNAADYQQNNQIDGLPQAIKILSLRLPKFRGAQVGGGFSPLVGQESGGLDPYLSAVFETLSGMLNPAQGGMRTGGAPDPVVIPGTGNPQPGPLSFGDDAGPMSPFPMPQAPPDRRGGQMGPGRRTFGF